MSNPSGESRIPRLSIEDARAAAESAGIRPEMAELSVFRVLLRHPELAKVLNGMLGMLLFQGNKLDKRLRELIIMRIGWTTGSCHEWTQHWRVARQLDIPEDVILAVRDWKSSTVLDQADRAVLQATDETLEHGTISPETWALCEKYVPDEQARLELPVAIGNWRLFSQMLRSLEIPLEDGVAAWPPDGLEPTS